MRRNQATAPRVSSPAAHREPTRRLRLGENARLYLRLVLLLLVVIGCVVGLAQLLRLPQLTVTATSTQIGGSQRIPAEEIYAVSQLEGRNILLVRPEDVGARVAGIQGIAGADVHVRLPNQVLIDVREYQPLVAWHGVTTTVWLSADGAAVPQVGDVPALRLNDRTGTPPEETARTWQYVLPNLVEIRSSHPDLRELSYGKLEGLYFLAPEGWTVWLGDTGSMATKLALLEATQREIAAQGIYPKIIDIRFDDKKAILRQ
jgi:cell division septal protein FtsQ